MSELICANRKSRNPRRQLLASVSMVVLAAGLAANGSASADEDAPTMWIDLGGQVERTDGVDERFLPPFTTLLDTRFTSPAAIERAPRFFVGGNIGLTVKPAGTDWQIVAAIRYGRSNRAKASHAESHPPSPYSTLSNPAFNYYHRYRAPAVARQFSDVTHNVTETYAIADFRVGKDVGLGIWGNSGTSSISAGVRFAQFTAKSSTSLGADPNFNIAYVHRSLPSFGKYQRFPRETWDLYSAKANATRSFRGIGPTLSWDASAGLVGEPEAGRLTFDFGLNAAVLFGRQKVKVHHETKASHQVYQHNYAYGGGEHPGTYISPRYSYSTGRTQSRTVTVPNLGGFAGLSLRFPNAKISMGYRGDFFFGAIDGGIDVRKTYSRNFYGPFATISIGLGG